MSMFKGSLTFFPSLVFFDSLVSTELCVIAVWKKVKQILVKK